MGSKTGFFTVEDGDKLSASAYYTFVSYPSSVFEDTMAFQKQFGLRTKVVMWMMRML